MAKKIKEDNLKKKIIEKALQDPNFKQALIANPKQALADEFNLHIPADIEIEVLEETSNHFYLVIPFYDDHHDCPVGW